MKKRIVFAAIPVLILCIVILFPFNFKPDALSLNQSDYGTDGKKIAYVAKGYGIQLCNPDGKPHSGNVAALSDNGEFSYSIRIVNNTGKDGKFILKLLLNYEEVEFMADNRERYLNGYPFELKSNREKIIPVRFRAGRLPFTLNDLTISLVSGTDKHASLLKETSKFYGISLIFNLKRESTAAENTEKIPALPKTGFEVMQPEKNNFMGVLLNNDFTKPGSIAAPPLEILAKPGERVKLALRAGGEQDCNEYVFWMSVGFNQVSMDNERKYLYFRVREPDLIYKEISFTAPEKKGRYEICGFLAMRPWKEFTAKAPPSVIKTSSRFTLTVR